MMNYNSTCQLEKSTGTDVYGQKNLAVPITERCAVVRSKTKMEPTPPRSQMSATRGYAWEFLQEFEVHLASTTTAAINDKLTVLGHEVRITGLAPGLDAFTGRIDHYVVFADQWD